MDNFNQTGSNPQLDILNNLTNQTGVNQNNSPFLTNNNSNVQTNQNNFPQNNPNSEGRFFQNGNTPVENTINNSPNMNPNNTTINVIPTGQSMPSSAENANSSPQQAAYQPLTGNPFASENTYIDPRKDALSNNNFDKEVPKNGFVDVLKEGGVNIEVPQNKFINDNNNFNETSINDLNINGEYNKLPSIDYSNDPKVIENINNQKKKNTIKISKELSTFLLICAILFVFIFIMPYIFDLIRNIQSR